MADDNEILPEDITQKRQELFEQMAAVFAMNGMSMTEEMMEYMQPLLDGSMSFEQHRIMLESMIKRLEA